MKILLLLISSVLSFGFLDRFLYGMIHIPCERLQPDRLVHRSLIPNQNCRMEVEEFETDFNVNSLGLRDYEIPESKQEGEYRVLFLGDSFTVGWGVELSETFVKQAERNLSSRLNVDKIRAINAGVPAYSPLLESLYLEYRGIKLEPDIVVVQLFINDFFDERKYMKKAVRSQNGDITGVYVELKQHAPTWLINYLDGRSVSYFLFKKYESQLWCRKREITAWIKRAPKPDCAKSGDEFAVGDPDNDQYAIVRQIPLETFNDLFEPVVKRIAGMSGFLKARGIPMAVVIIPAGFQVDSSQWEEEAKERLKLTGDEFSDRVMIELAAYFNKRGMLYLDLTQSFKNYLVGHPDAKIYYEKDWHLTPLGHKVTGESVADFLVPEIQKSFMSR